jgi:thiol-disulfide isomerase/thioredoxin
MIVVFLASWCVPCQNLMPAISEIEKALHPSQVKVAYVFAHDAESDALGFAAEYGINQPILADHELLKAFKNPPLPSIYLGDRNTWLAGRWHEPTPDDLVKLKGLVKGMTYF